MTTKMKKKNSTVSGSDRKRLDVFRRDIDGIDQGLVRLLNKRAVKALKVGAIKKTAGVGVYDPAREADVLRRVSSLNKGPLSGAAIRSIYRNIISACRSRQK